MGVGEPGKKTETTQYVGGKSVSEKSQVTHTGRGAWGGSHSFGRASKTETGVQLLLHNRSSEEDDTDPLMWWKQHQQEFPRLARMARQYLAVPASSASPERLFSSVGLVKSDLRGRLLDSTLIDVMWAKQAP